MSHPIKQKDQPKATMLFRKSNTNFQQKFNKQNLAYNNNNKVVRGISKNNRKK